jgi:hypothetical protein
LSLNGSGVGNTVPTVTGPPVFTGPGGLVALERSRNAGAKCHPMFE